MNSKAGMVSGSVSSVLCALIVSLGLCLSSALPAFSAWETPEKGEQSDLQGHEAEGPEALPAQVTAPILMYHYISELPADADRYRVNLTVEPDDFTAQLQYLSDAGYHTITLTDLYLRLTQGYPLPDQPIVLTIDDGYRDAYDVAFPLLLDFGFTGTFFILATPAHFESPRYLTWQQMKEMADAGMEIQGHGREHVDLRGRSYDFLVYQILGVQEAIQFHTGRMPRFFCYPSGRYDADVVAVLKSAGYWGATTTAWGKTQSANKLFEMPRIRIQGGTSLESFADYLN